MDNPYTAQTCDELSDPRARRGGKETERPGKDEMKKVSHILRIP